MCICLCICIYIYMYVCIYIYMYVCMCMYIYIYVYVYVCAHAHTHTCIRTHMCAQLFHSALGDKGGGFQLVCDCTYGLAWEVIFDGRKDRSVV